MEDDACGSYGDWGGEDMKSYPPEQGEPPHRGAYGSYGGNLLRAITEGSTLETTLVLSADSQRTYDEITKTMSDLQIRLRSTALMIPVPDTHFLAEERKRKTKFEFACACAEAALCALDPRQDMVDIPTADACALLFWARTAVRLNVRSLSQDGLLALLQRFKGKAVYSKMLFAFGYDVSNPIEVVGRRLPSPTSTIDPLRFIHCQ
jgi:hypothetical protein